MEKLKYYLIKYKFLLLVVVMLFFLVISIVYAETKSVNEEITEDNDIVTEKTEVVSEENIVNKVRVDIKGYVKDEGVYELDSDSRVIDVINMAGGLIDGANTEYINLSKKIVDEMVIIIYSNNEIEKFKKTDKEIDKEIIYIEYECVCPDNKNDACITTEDTVNTNGTKNSKVSEKMDSVTDETRANNDGKISINNGSLEELMTLNGIGESKAKAIIKYREDNGPFEALEDILNVSGIGESAYSKIKDNIKL